MGKRGQQKDNPEVLQAFGKLVKTQRLKAGLTTELIAEMLGISNASIINIEAGRQGTQLGNIVKLCIAFKCKPNDIIPDFSDRARTQAVAVKYVTKIIL